MIDRVGISWLEGRNDTFDASKELVVALGRLVSLPVPLNQFPKFHREETRLDRVEPPIVALEVMTVLLHLSVIAQHANFLRKQFIAGCNRSGFPAGPEVLSRIEAKRGRPAH